MRLSDSAELFAVCAEDTFRYWVTLVPREWNAAGFDSFVASVLALPRCRPFTVRVDGAVAGMTTFLDIREEGRGVEIGMTWYAPEWRGTFVNPACKRMLMAHAFETLGAIRVQLKTDARNAHSRGAILKLGARFEGILRKHGVQIDGTIRDTAMFSVTDDEWPEVKDQLDQRLKALRALSDNSE